MRFRQSTLNTWMDCQLKAKYRHIDQLPTKQNAKASFGTIIHFCLDQYDQTGNVELAKETFKDYWHNPEKLGVTPDNWPRFTTFGGLREKGLDILDGYHEKNRWEPRQVIANEHNFLVPFGEHEFEGTVDCVEVKKSGKGKELLRIKDFKALPLDAEILTPTGWMFFGDLADGDIVMGANGYPQRVTGVYPQGIVPAYRVTFSDGASTVCSEDHLWTVTDLYGVTRTLPLSEFKSLRKGNNHRYFLPTTAPCRFTYDEVEDNPGWVYGAWPPDDYELRDWDPENGRVVPHDLPIHPYILGVLLGDGGLTQDVKVHNCEPDIRKRIEYLLPSSLRTVTIDEQNWAIRGRSRQSNTLLDALRQLGLMGLGSPEKFIPPVYLRAPVAAREELLKGLMDTDGGSSTRTDYRTTSLPLRDGVIELCRSLGGVPTTSQFEGYYVKDGVRHDCKTCHVVNVRVPENPFFLLRKWETWKVPQRRLDRAITNIERVPDQPMQCIKVSNPDGLYIVDDYVVTHNTNARKPSIVELALNLQFTVYIYASLQREFWVGNGPGFPGMANGQWLFETFAQMPRRGIWYQLWTNQELDAGGRDQSDFDRLYRLCNEVERAIQLEVFVPNISADSCGICDFQKPCGVSPPTADEMAAQDNAWI